MTIQFEESKQLKKLANVRRQEAEDATKRLAEKFGMAYADLSAIPISIEALELIPLEIAQSTKMAAIQIMGSKVQVVMENPQLPGVSEELAKLKERRLDPQTFLVSPFSLEKVWRAYEEIPVPLGEITGRINVSAERLESFRTEITSLEILAQKIKAMRNATISDLLELLIAGGLATDASDIHIEPEAASVRLRYRIDGILADIASMTVETFKFLLGRIKLISELKVNIKDKAQDGRFTIQTPGGDIEVRVSTLPGPYGENVVMRILNPKAINVSLADLGMQPWMEADIKKQLKKPNGMIITTGPTGSGKTTTLYAFLRAVHEPGIKIITLEDPIEYHLEGIEQTQVEQERGYDFASGLRAILRQDPDVILVGEIRDKETAETAMHASLTGHLVFSTLHTNNAAGTVPRLIDIGVKPNIIAPAINVAMAQRLVRKVCAKCKKTEPAKPEELEIIKKELDAMPPNIARPDISNLQLARPVGCAECHRTGYRGRTGVYEIILVDDSMENQILKEPSEADIKVAATKQGQITLKQDAMLKVIAGITDLAEVERVVG